MMWLSVFVLVLIENAIRKCEIMVSKRRKEACESISGFKYANWLSMSLLRKMELFKVL